MLQLIPAHKSLFNVPSGKGMPLGNLSSQYFANLYLNELDVFIKHHLKVKYYIRYVDDMIFFAESAKTIMAYKKRTEEFLLQHLKLQLHPQKIVMQPCRHGVDFLGYFVKKDYILVRRRVVKSFRRKLYFYNHLFDPVRYPFVKINGNGTIEKMYRMGDLDLPVSPSLVFLKNIQSSINSYYGIFAFADTYKLRKSLYEKNFGLLRDYFKPKNKWYKAMTITIKEEIISGKSRR